MTVQTPTGGIFSSYTVLTKSMIGAGILGLSHSLADCGWSVGIGYMIGAPILMLFSQHLLAVLAVDFMERQRAHGMHHNLDFVNVARSISPRSVRVLEFAIVILCISSAVAYLVLSAQLIADLIDTYDRYLTVCLTKIIMVAVLTPFCYLKSLKHTTIPNVVALMCLLYVVSMVFVTFSSDEVRNRSAANANELWRSRSFPKAIGGIMTFLFSYCCSVMFFGVAADLQHMSIKRLNIVSGLTIMTGVVLNTLAAVLPFLTNGRNAEDNFLSNGDSSKAYVKAAKIACVFQVGIGFALIIHPLRSCILETLTDPEKFTTTTEFKVRVVTTTLLLALILGIAVAADEKLSDVFGYAGILGANSLCFVIPTYLYIVRFFPKTKQRQNHGTSISNSLQSSSEVVELTDFTGNFNANKESNRMNGLTAVSSAAPSSAALSDSTDINMHTLASQISQTPPDKIDLTFVGAGVLFVASIVLYPLGIYGVSK